MLVVVLAACARAPDDPPQPASPPQLAPPEATSPPDADEPEPDGDAAEAPGLPASDAPLPPLVLAEVATLEAPIDTTVLADGTVLVAERGGIVRILIEGTDGRGDPSSAAGAVVVDVSDRTTTDGERGLLSIAVAPRGDELFLSLTDPEGHTLVEAHPLAGTTVTGPPRTVFRLEQPFANHNGGPILFLPDGTLLLGLGDGGGSGDPLEAGQDLATPLGGLVRLDVRGGEVRIPTDNPFLDRDGAAPEIAAFGLRNPWRVSLDAPRGELWIADVGQAEREEVNRIALEELLGANFGWPLREGSLPFAGDEPDGHVRPLYDYGHGPGCSVTGGLVLRDPALPELTGAYVFTDLCDGRIRMLALEDGTAVEVLLGVEGERIVGFGEDATGALLVLELGGRVLRLVRG
jgi:glucose/arabinose dehydrogenase